MREDLIMKLSEMIDNATNGIKYELANHKHEGVPMIDVIVSLLNHNIRELNDIMSGEEE